MDGYSNAEIAEIMKVTKMGVESLVYRAKKKVEEEYNKIKKKS
jgi:DNA-directed RNA polymerase specialized sigma24 family protein